jgi:serine/threonine-protein kinase RsbW
VTHPDSRTPVVKDEVVDLSVPADPAYLSVMRSATAGLGTHLNLTMDQIEDLQIAVAEACALLIAGRGHHDRSLATCFTVEKGLLTVRIDGPSPLLPSDGNFAWTMLHALSAKVSTGQNESGSWIVMTCRAQGVPA